MRLGLFVLSVLVSECLMAPTVPSPGNLWPLSAMTELFIEASTLSPSQSSLSPSSVMSSFISPSSSTFSERQVVRSIDDTTLLSSFSSSPINRPSEYTTQALVKTPELHLKSSRYQNLATDANSQAINGMKSAMQTGGTVTASLHTPASSSQSVSRELQPNVAIQASLKDSPDSTLRKTRKVNETSKDKIGSSRPGSFASVVSSHLGSDETSLFHLGPLQQSSPSSVSPATNVSAKVSSPISDVARGFRSVWGDKNRLPDAFIVQPSPFDGYIQFPIPVTVDLFLERQNDIDVKLTP